MYIAEHKYTGISHMDFFLSILFFLTLFFLVTILVERMAEALGAGK